MQRDEVLRKLRENLPELRRRFAVRSLKVFGSVARGEASPESDVDVLVEFTESPGFSGYMALKFYLEDLLGKKVDLVMSGALRPWARPIVEQEAIRVA